MENLKNSNPVLNDMMTLMMCASAAGTPTAETRNEMKPLVRMMLSRIGRNYGIEIPTEEQVESQSNRKEMVYGIKGLADLLHVSIPTAQKYKNEGIYDAAMSKFGKKFAWDRDMVLEIAKCNK